jgi:cysteine-rich repeat protein
MKSMRHLLGFALLPAIAPGCIFPFDSPDCEPETVYVEVEDFDRDGSLEYDDCDDTNPAIHPGAYDVPDDGIDQDCDGLDATRRGAVGACSLARPALFGENPGDTSRSEGVLEASCSPLIGSAQVFVFVPTGIATLNRLTLTVESESPHAVHVRAACLDAASELGCAGANARGLSVEVEPGVPIHVVVSAVGEPGPFVLTARQEPLLCGDRYVATGETCGDGNWVSGDGCSASCQLED